MNRLTKRVFAIVIGIILIAVAFIIVSLAFWTTELDTLNENNTIEYSATVQSVKKTKDGYLIEVAEYDVGLKVEKDLLTKNYDLTSAISEGDSIDFRMVFISNLSEIEGFDISIFSLAHEGEEIIPLSRTNDRYKRSDIIGKIMTVSFAILLVSVAIYIYIWSFKKTKKTDEKEKSGTPEESASA